jgi:uncharacterized protein YdhG (YjbR/CyaY superfamily)
MQSKALTVDQYFEQVEPSKHEAMQKLRAILKKKLKGTEECMSYGMAGYVVPFKTYPDGYHCDTSLPLPYVALAAQKNFIALYHMGVYATPALLDWFVQEFPKHSKSKLDMGKSCIRFKKMDDIPYKLIEELLGKMSVKEWIATYEKLYKK